MNIKGLLLSVIILFPITAFSQDYSAKQDKGKSISKQEEIKNQESKSAKTIKSNDYSQTAHEFGLASGFTTGYGLSYRYWPNKVGFQFTTFPVVSSEDKNLSIGLTSLFKLDERSWYRIFAFAGGNLNWTENSNHDEYFSDFSGPFVWAFNLNAPFEEQKKFTIGAGPGVEFTPGKHFGINLMTGFRYTSIDYAYSRDEKLVTLTADIAIYFRF